MPGAGAPAAALHTGEAEPTAEQLGDFERDPVHNVLMYLSQMDFDDELLRAMPAADADNDEDVNAYAEMLKERYRLSLDDRQRIAEAFKLYAGTGCAPALGQRSTWRLSTRNGGRAACARGEQLLPRLKAARARPGRRCKLRSCAGCGVRRVCDASGEGEDSGTFQEWRLDALPECFKLSPERVQEMRDAPVVDLLQPGGTERCRAALARVYSFHPMPDEIQGEQTEGDWRAAAFADDTTMWHLHSDLVQERGDEEGGDPVRSAPARA